MFKKAGTLVSAFFINTHGKNTEDVSPEFLALMRFIEYNKEEHSEELSSNFLKIVERVTSIKASEKVGVRFMQRWEEEVEWKEEGREEGRDSALLDVIRNLMNNTHQSFEKVCSSMGISAEDQARYEKML